MNENIDLYNADAETLVRCASMKSVWRERWEKGDGEDLQAWLDTPSPKSIRTSRSLRASSPTRLPSAEDAMKRVSIKRTALAWYISTEDRDLQVILSELQAIPGILYERSSCARIALSGGVHHALVGMASVRRATVGQQGANVLLVETPHCCLQRHHDGAHKSERGEVWGNDWCHIARHLHNKGG